MRAVSYTIHRFGPAERSALPNIKIRRRVLAICSATVQLMCAIGALVRARPTVAVAQSDSAYAPLIAASPT